jgi:oligosaccharyltransferase complex subunit delta (ribophorin II)
VRALASPLSATLLLSSPGQKPLRYELGTLSLPSDGTTRSRRRHDLPPREGEPAFAPLPQITHTFRPDEKVIGFPKAAAGVAALVAPWALLFILVSTCIPHVAVKALDMQLTQSSRSVTSRSSSTSRLPRQ